MPTQKSHPKRTKSILRILTDHGPLTIDLLQKMIEPTMTKPGIRRSLAILRKKNLIERLTSTAHTTFYMASQSLEARINIAEVLGCNAREIKKPLLRRRDWFHNQWCEYWIKNMKRRFPDAEIVRESSAHEHQIAANVLQINAQDFDLRPDFLLMLPKSENQNSVYLAFEIERTRKSDRRLIRKFKKYMDGTRHGKPQKKFKIDRLRRVWENN